MTDTTKTQTEFESLLTPVLPAAYRAALHFTRSPADAEDAVQQASLQAWRAFATFEGGTNFRAWFLCIITNVCRSEFRRQSRTPIALAFDDPSTEGLPLSDVLADESDLSPEARTVQHLDAAEIQAALLSLPERMRRSPTPTTRRRPTMSSSPPPTCRGRPVGILSRLRLRQAPSGPGRPGR